MASEPAKIPRGRIAFHRKDDARPFPTARERLEARPGNAPGAELDAGVARSLAAGIMNGIDSRVLISTPALHVSWFWAKAGFPGSAHSHSADCFYLVLAGEMAFGTERLQPGDAATVPANAVYSWKSGDEGVEFLEIRTSNVFDTRYMTRSPAALESIITHIIDSQGAWRAARPPLGLMSS